LFAITGSTARSATAIPCNVTGNSWLIASHDDWRDCSAANDLIIPQILDGYNVGTVIARELHLPEGQVSGETYATGRLPDTPLQPRNGA
jgi:hypothetical protein